jgi:hypothetical protein
VSRFLSDENQAQIKSKLKLHFHDDENIKLFIDSDLPRRLFNFSHRIERELSVSDPIEGANLFDEVRSYNTQFIHETIQDVERDIAPNMVPHYTVKEIPQCNGRSMHDKPLPRPNRSPTDELKSWSDNPASLEQYRDDSQGDYRVSDRNRPKGIYRQDATTGSACYNPDYDIVGDYCAVAQYGQNYCRNTSNNYSLNQYRTYRDPQDYQKSKSCNPRDYAGNWASNTKVYPYGNPSYLPELQRQPLRKEGFASQPTPYETSVPSISYCDQSGIGTGFAHDYQFNTFYSQRLNKDKDPHTLQPFGYSTPESDARLLSRRTFRKNEDGEENGIPRYERRLQRRNLDRDIGETFADTQYDYKQRGYDMSDINKRVNHKQRVADTNKTNYSIADNPNFLYGINYDN